MRTIPCPRCGWPVRLRRFLSVSKPFCARCGWNLARAEVALAGKSTALILVPIGIAVVGLLAAFTAARVPSPLVFLFPLIFGSVVLFPVWSYVATRKAIAAAKLSSHPDLALAQPPLDPALQQLQALPRPRPVRFRFRGNLVVVALVMAIFFISGGFAFVLSGARGGHLPKSFEIFPILFPLLFATLIFGILILSPFYSEKANRPLLRDGELAFARVIAQRTIPQGKASYSQITYEFKANSGQVLQSSAKDLSFSVFEDMTIPVFYDPTNPSKNIPLCSTYLQISSSPC